MGETIVLPKSGVVLTQVNAVNWRFGDIAWLGQFRVGPDGTGFYATLYGSRFEVVNDDLRVRDGDAEKCTAWLDARVLEARAALTPPGHVLVGPDARERIARAIMRSSPTKLVIGGASIDCVDAKAADEMASRIVNGFLSALGVRGGA